MNKVLIVGSRGSCAYSKMFREKGFEVLTEFDSGILHDIVSSADIVQFTGGEDVTPSYYGESPHPFTGNSLERDNHESKIFNMCRTMNKPMAGICRGGQFLNVLSGGKLYQHVDNHGIYGTHPVIDVESSEVYECSSTHHQMMKPSNNAIIIGVIDGLSSFKEHVELGVTKHVTNDQLDIEVVYYPHTNALCFQPHPEFNGVPQCREYYFSLINKYLGV